LGYGGITQIVDSPVDEETGYRIQYVAGSFLGNAFRAECDAYNFAMREHHQKHKPGADIASTPSGSSLAPDGPPLESEKRPKLGNIPDTPTIAGAVQSQLSEKPAVKLIRREERGKTRDGRDMVMIFEELQRDEKTSIVTIKAVNGGSVGSAMFMVQGASDIAKARGAACFINLKEWEGKDGAWMYLIGFAPDKGVDPTTYFDLKEPLPAEKRHQFLSVKDYEPLFNRRP
jgi:hypothetical protein